MSAWLVENGHIDILVNALATHDLLDGQNPATIGQLLWTENNRSINHRYSERTRHPRYVLRTTEAPLHPVAVLKAIDCFIYQSCEHPGWTRSRARKLVERLRAAILEANPELAKEVPSRYYADRTEAAYLTHPVYDLAPWGFTYVEQAAAITY